MMNIKYMVDSTSDIPHDFAQEHDIAVLGMPISCEDEMCIRDRLNGPAAAQPEAD